MCKFKPILSICIPTYNREKELLESLTSIVSGVRPENNMFIEFIIRDNGSVDNTEKVVLSVINNNPSVNIRYIKSDENAGYDENIFALYREAKGRYVWFIGDRYVLNVKLSRIIRVLVEYQPSFVAFSDLFMKKKVRISNFINLNLNAVSVKFDENLQISFCDIVTLLTMEIVPLFPSLPAVIFEASIDRKTFHEIWEKFRESQFIHIPLAVESIKASKSRVVCVVHVEEKTFSSLSVVNTFRFDPTLMTKGMRDIYQDYPFIGSYSDYDAINFFLYDGLVSYKLGIKYIGVENPSQVYESLDKLGVVIGSKQKIIIALWGLPFVWPYRLMFLLVNVFRGLLESKGASQGVRSLFLSMVEFDKQIRILRKKLIK